MYDISGDIIIHYVGIECFAHQFWQGDLAPRWCFEADAGLGSPFFLFYFPLPYYIGAFIYEPLHLLGADVRAVYRASVLLATIASAFAVRHWLRGSIGEGRAALIAALYLFLPYRMELMLFRSAYAELWLLAIAPMAFASARNLLHGSKNGTLAFAFWCTAMILCHIPASICMLIGLGVYMCVMSRAQGRPLLHAGAAVAAAFIIAAWHVLPAAYFIDFTAIRHFAYDRPWPNRFVTMADVLEHGRGRIILGLSLSIIGFTALSALAWLKRARIADALSLGEMKAWTLIGAIAILFTFPISAPFWNLINAIAPIGFPWRMQGVLTLALAYQAAMYVRWFASAKQLRTWKADAAVFLGLLMLYAQFSVTQYGEGQQNPLNEIQGMRLIAPYMEYRTQWVDYDYGFKDVKARYLLGENAPKVEKLAGNVQVTVIAWDWRGIALDIDARTPSRLRLYHHYFPLWQLQDAPPDARLSPEKGTGYMQLDVPSGHYTLRLSTLGIMQTRSEAWRGLWAGGHASPGVQY